MRSKTLKLCGETCEYCDGTLADVVVSELFRVRGRLIVLENVPLGICPKCGEKYYPAAVLKRVEEAAKEIARGRQRRLAHVVTCRRRRAAT